MIRKLVSLIWAKMPYFLRLRVIRVTQEKFTVSVAAIVTNERNEVLLLNHVLRPFSSWGIPGGFMEANEQPDVAMRREMREETGLELLFLEMIRVRTLKRHVEILFRARATEKGEVKSREITDLGWYEIGKMPEDMSRVQKILIEEVLSAEI